MLSRVKNSIHTSCIIIIALSVPVIIISEELYIDHTVKSFIRKGIDR